MNEEIERRVKIYCLACKFTEEEELMVYRGAQLAQNDGMDYIAPAWVRDYDKMVRGLQ